MVSRGRPSALKEKSTFFVKKKNETDNDKEETIEIMKIECINDNSLHLKNGDMGAEKASTRSSLAIFSEFFTMGSAEGRYSCCRRDNSPLSASPIFSGSIVRL